MPALKYPHIIGESPRDRRLRLYRIWAESNKEKLRAYFNQYSKQHRERRNEIGRATYYRNRVAHLARKKQYKLNHKEQRKETQRIYDSRPDVVARRVICSARWVKNNPHIIAAYRCRRRAIKKSSGSVSILADKVVSRWKRAGAFVCYYCAGRFPRSRLHIDHIVPLSKGGPHSPDNLCRSCNTCNLKKRALGIRELKFLKQTILPL